MATEPKPPQTSEVIDSADNIKQATGKNPNARTLSSGAASPSADVIVEQNSRTTTTTTDTSTNKQTGDTEDVINAYEYYKNKVDAEQGKLIKDKLTQEAIQKSTESARYIAKNEQSANEQFVTNEYQANQTASNYGWSGGYAMDAQRQLQYLRSSIQADIFSQKELQELGYNSSLQQAYISAELEATNLALEQYQAAENTAMQKAQLTGTYIAPHIQDLMTQANAASAKLKSGTEDTERYQKVYDYATKMLTQIANQNGQSNYNGINIDETTKIVTVKGIETLAYLQHLADKNAQEAEAKLNETQAEIQKIQIEQAIQESYDVSTGHIIPNFVEVSRDENNKPIYKLAGYGDTNVLPSTDEGKKNLQDYYKNKPEALDQSVNNTLSKIGQDFADAITKAKENGKSLSFDEFYKSYNGLKLGAFIDEYYTGTKGEFTFGGITIKKSADKNSWVISDGRNASNANDNTSIGGTGGSTTNDYKEYFNKYTGKNLVDKLTEITLTNYTEKLSTGLQEKYIEAVMSSGKTSQQTEGAGANFDYCASLTVDVPEKWTNDKGKPDKKWTFTLGNKGITTEYITSLLANKKHEGKNISNFTKNGQMVKCDSGTYMYSQKTETFINVSMIGDGKAAGNNLSGTYFDLCE